MEQQGKIRQEKYRKNRLSENCKTEIRIKFSYGSTGEKSKPKNRLKLAF